jgi:hypothetical protein
MKERSRRTWTIRRSGVMGTVFSEQKSHGLCEYRPRRKVLERDTDTHINRHTDRQRRKG